MNYLKNNKNNIQENSILNQEKEQRIIIDELNKELFRTDNKLNKKVL